MPDADTELLCRAQQHSPSDPDVLNCWSFILQGLELGWLDREEITALIGFLREGRDWGNEELLFAHSGDRVRISFLDDNAECSPVEMIKELEALLVA